MLPDPYEPQRLQMVTDQIKRRGIHDERLLETMRQVPRHLFVGEQHRELAYTDGPLPIGGGQTISQPYIVALMTWLLHLKGDERVLEIGTGSGYQAAILSHLAIQVYTIEFYADLAERARETLKSLGLSNVEVITGDGSQGLPEHSPYQGILVAAAAPQAPLPILEQLTVGGRLVLPVGAYGGQNLQVWERMEKGWDMNEIAPVAFVPLRGALGWKEGEW